MSNPSLLCGPRVPLRFSTASVGSLPARLLRTAQTICKKSLTQETSALPAELIATDLEVRALLSDQISCKSLHTDDQKERFQKALQIADNRGLIRDRAIVEAALGSLLLGEGKLDMAFLTFQKAWQDSIDASNEILEADILNSLAAEAELKGNRAKSLELLTRALTLSNRNASLYEKARTLGALGRLQVLEGKNDEARNSFDEALNIDRLNGYPFEALHMVYKASYLGLTGNEAQAMDLLVQAKSKAIVARNTYAFVTAETAYALGLVRKGKTDEAIRELELVKRGDLQTIAPEANDRECLTNALTLPMFRIILLEGMTNALDAANLKKEEIDIWHEMFAISRDVGLLAGEAEAENKVANLESQLQRNEEALKDYAVAVDLYRKLGNELLLNQVEISESVLLVNSHRGTEALPLIQEIISYAKRLSLRQLQFRAYITLADIYQTSGETVKARDALETATSLIRPGPFDEEIDNKTVHQMYVSLSNIYRNLQIPSKELVSIDQAFVVSFHLKDQEAQRRDAIYLNQRLNELHIRESIEQRQKEGQLADVLIYSYILNVPGDPSNNNDNWQRIVNLPFQIAQKPGGVSELTEILKSVGPFLGTEQIPMLNALAQYYIAVGADPILAEKYAIESDKLLNDLKGDQSALKVQPTCVLAISYGRQGKTAMAQAKSAECLVLAEKTHEEQTIAYADTVDSMVQAQTGNVAAAKTSLERLIAKAPQNPDLIAELAMSLASAKLYDEANSQLDIAIKKYLSTGNRSMAAGAYERVSVVLNSDSSSTAKKLQFEYLNSALKLFREGGAEAEEAGVLVALGDYFVKITQSKLAIENYRMAKELAQKRDQKNIVGQSLLGLANAYQAQKDFVRARDLDSSEEFMGKLRLR